MFYYLRKTNEATVNLKTGRFDDRDSVVIVSSVSKAVQKNFFQLCTASFTLLMMTAVYVLPKPLVLIFTVILFFQLKLFASHIYDILLQ